MLSYQEQKNITSLVASLGTTGVYCWTMLHDKSLEFLSSPEASQFWGKLFLLLIPISIVVRIVAIILLNISYRIRTREEEPNFADELDKLIELRANRNGYFMFVVGFLAAMAALALGYNSMLLFPIFLVTGMLSEVVSTISSQVMYRRGV